MNIVKRRYILYNLCFLLKAFNEGEGEGGLHTLEPPGVWEGGV